MPAFHVSVPAGFRSRSCDYLRPNDAFCTSFTRHFHPLAPPPFTTNSDVKRKTKVGGRESKPHKGTFGNVSGFAKKKSKKVSSSRGTQELTHPMTDDRQNVWGYGHTAGEGGPDQASVYTKFSSRKNEWKKDEQKYSSVFMMSTWCTSGNTHSSQQRNLIGVRTFSGF